MQLEKSTKIHSWTGGVSFIKRACSYSDHSTSIFWTNTIKLSSFYNTRFLNQLGFTLLKDELFAHYFQDIKEHCNRQIHLSFQIERNRECCFSIKNFQIVGEQNFSTKTINEWHCEVYSFYKNRYYIYSKCGIFDRNFDMLLKHFSSGTIPRSKYSWTDRRRNLPK